MPQIHGMIANAWFDRASGRDVACTGDAAVTNVTYGALAARGGDSSARLATPTLADEMRAQFGIAPRVVTMALKARSAISLAGHRSTVSTWFDGPRGFVTSPAMQALGLGGAVLDSSTGAELYLSREAAGRLGALAPREWDALRTSLEQVDGIARAWRTVDLLAGRYEAASDKLAHAARLSAFAGRSGDIILLLDPYWFPYHIVATHGTPYAYDQHVPLVFVGPQFVPGRYTAVSSPADIVPTLARIIGVTLAAADGMARVDALTAPPARPETTVAHPQDQRPTTP